MRTAKLSAIILLCASFFLVNGCTDQVAQLQLANKNLSDRNSKLSADLAAAEMKLTQLENQLAGLTGTSDSKLLELQNLVDAYEKAIDEKDDLIKRLQEKILTGQAQLPVELSTQLEDFARTNGMVTYDKEKGIVKFSSDLLFNKGSDEVTPAAAAAV